MTAVTIENSPEYDVAIIGGGASGMACALFLSKWTDVDPGLRPSILLIEKNARLGKKLLLTGNGRCNLTNRDTSTDRYHGSHPGFARFALSKFGPEHACDFFRDIGLDTYFDETGKAFPKSLNASSVLDCMRFSLEESGVLMMVSESIESIRKNKSDFILLSSTGRVIRARYVVIACGGAASPFTGSDGSGAGLLESLGHKVIPPIPGIVQIKTSPDFVKAVSGVKVIASATLVVDGDPIRSESGEILFTDYGLSGPPILQLSGFASRASRGLRSGNNSANIEVSIDFMPDKSELQVRNMLLERRAVFPNRKLEQMLIGVFHNRLAVRLIKNACEKPLSALISTFSDNEIDRLSSQIKNCVFTVTGVMPLTNAQITIGGACTEEFEPETMRSLKCEHLYACGEVLDIDGDCGGYNLQWAWSSAYIAAKSIARLFGGKDFSAPNANGGAR